MEEVEMTIAEDGQVRLHFKGIKADVRHSLAKELEKLIGPATFRKHGPLDQRIEERTEQDVRVEEDT